MQISNKAESTGSHRLTVSDDGADEGPGGALRGEAEEADPRRGCGSGERARVPRHREAREDGFAPGPLRGCCCCGDSSEESASAASAAARGGEAMARRRAQRRRRLCACVRVRSRS